LLGQFAVGQEDETGRPPELGLHAGLLVGVQELNQRQQIGQRLARACTMCDKKKLSFE
jgi:hypothetical protein